MATEADVLRRWPALQTAWQSGDEYLQRIVQELRFVEALLQVKPDCVPDGRAIWERALQQAADALTAGRRAVDLAGDVETTLAPFAPLAKAYTVHCVGHAHIDMNWMWPWPETVEICHDTFTTVNRLMSEYPGFRFSQSQAAVYHAMEQHSPDVFAMLRRRIESGQWEVTANLWVEGDKNLAAGEALCRQILTAKRYMRERFGFAYDQVQIACEPDTFGHARTLPQILLQAGISHYYFCRGGPEHQLFWWEGPDGSRVLAWNDSKLWYLGPVKPEYAVEVIRHEQATGMQDYLLVYGVGDHGGGPTRRDLALIRQMDVWPIWPRFRFSTFATFFSLAETAGDRLPVVADELNFVFRGCYTSQSGIKRANRLAENLLIRAEGMATVAHVNGWGDYPRESLVHAWQQTAFNQFHDILPGSGVKATYEYAQGLFQSTKTTADMTWKRSAQELAARLLHSNDGRQVVVFNSHPWQRSEGVLARIFDISRSTPSIELTADDGTSISAQVFGGGGYWGHDYVDVAFTATDVPGLGYRTYTLRESIPSGDLLGPAVNRQWSGLTAGHGVEWPSTDGAWAAADGRLQNEFYRLQVEPESGAVVSLIDRHTGDELAPQAARIGLLQVLYEVPHGMSAWEIGQITHTLELLQGGRLKLVASGPARACIRIEHKLESSSITIDISLCAGVPQIDWRVQLDWFAAGNAQKDAPMLKMAFPLAISGAVARFETPFGSVNRPTDGAEVPTQQWVALQGVTRAGNPYGVALLNDCKYGCDVKGSTIRMTLLRTSYEPDPYPEVGRHEMRFALAGRAGNLTNGAATRLGQSFNNPLRALALYEGGAPQTGALTPASPAIDALAAAPPVKTDVLSASGGFLTIGPENVGFGTLKMAEDGDDAVLRIYETDGVATTAVVAFGWPVTQAFASDLLEQPGSEVYDVQDGVVQVPLKPFEIKTLLLKNAGR